MGRILRDELADEMIKMDCCSPLFERTVKKSSLSKVYHISRVGNLSGMHFSNSLWEVVDGFSTD